MLLAAAQNAASYITDIVYVCMLYFYGLPFVAVLPPLPLAVAFIRTCSAVAVVYSAAAAADTRRVVYIVAVARTAMKNGSVRASWYPSLFLCAQP